MYEVPSCEHEGVSYDVLALSDCDFSCRYVFNPKLSEHEGSVSIVFVMHCFSENSPINVTILQIITRAMHNK